MNIKYHENKITLFNYVKCYNLINFDERHYYLLFML